MQEYVDGLIKRGLVNEESEEFLLELFNSYLISYDYYGLKKESWIKIFDKSVNLALKTDNFTYYITMVLNKEMFDYFKENYNKDDMRLLNNFLIKLKRISKNYWEILKNLYKELFVRYIRLDEVLIQKLRNNSSVFKTLIKNLGIDNLSNAEIIKLCEGKYDYFIALKPQELDLKETIIIFREIAKYINYDESHLKRDIDNKEKIIEKIRFLLKNQNIINKIEKIFESINIKVEEASLKIVIYNFSLEELRKLKDDLKVYESTTFKDLSFIYSFLPSVSYCEKKKEDNKVKVKKTVKKEKVLPIEEKKDNNALYNYFPVSKNVSLEKKKEIVDYLMLILNPKERRLVLAFVKDELYNQRDRDLIKGKIMNLINIYNIWLENGILPEVGKEAFYDYFLNKDNITKVDKEQIIEILIRNFPTDIQGLIRRYYLKDISLSEEEKRRALEKINMIKEQYNRLLEVDLNISKDSTVYDIIPNNNGFQDRKIIERFLNSFNSYQRMAMERYIRGEYLEERDKARAKKDWNLVLIHYRAWLSKGVIKDIRLFKNVKVKEILEFLENERLKREWFDLSREKKEVYEDMFNVIEYQYHLRKVTNIQYRILMFNKLNEFIDINPKINIEELFRNYKDAMYIEMELEEKR